MNRIKTTLLATSVLVAATVAMAQPQPPTPPAQAGYPAINMSGVYVGIGSFAESTSSTINTGAGSSNLNGLGAALEASIGYQYRIPGNNFAFTEASVSYTNLGGSTSCQVSTTSVTGCSTKAPWGFGIEQAFGFNWTYPLTLIPAFSSLFGGVSPSGLIPSGVTPVSSVPYISVRADFDDVQATVGGTGSGSVWQVAPELRLGLINYLPQGGGVLKTYIGYEFSNASIAIGPGTSASVGNTLRAGLSYAF